MLTPQGEHLHARAEQARQQLDGTRWLAYRQTAVALPARLRENGLVQTLLQLRHRASEEDGAWRLLQDWLDDGSTSALNLAMLLPGSGAAERAAGIGALRDKPNYNLASHLALAEAQRLKRSAEALHLLPPAPLQPAGTPAQRPLPAPSPKPPVLTKAAAAVVTLPPFQQHFGRYWRFAGIPEQFSGSGKERDSYRSQHVAHVLAMAKASQAAGSAHGALYQAAYDRWVKWLAQLPASTAVAQVQQRLLLGMGAETVHETQLLLHPVTGMPYLPGSTLKGALRAWLDQPVKAAPAPASASASAPGSAAADGKSADAVAAAARSLQVSQLRLAATLRQLLGSDTTDAAGGQAGAACFLDAWWVPGDPAGPLVREVETPHHLEYYAGSQAQPTAWDAPVPVAQMAQRGRFLLAIAHNPLGAAWADALLQLLAQALGDAALGGLGSKAFAAGYGRMAVQLTAQPPRAARP